MVTSTLEKPQSKIAFKSLEELRVELKKQTKNEERLTKFQETIDEALKNGDRQGVIEFTENEWKTLISNENLPPFEEVQKLLKEKIEAIKETKTESKEKRGGIAAELKGKVEGFTESAKKKIEELQKKAEGLKKYTKPALFFMGIGLSMKIWGFKIANWFSGLFGKKGEYDEQIKLAEMEKDFLRDPEAAAKKYGEEAMKKVKEKAGEKVEEGKEGVLEKLGPLAALSGAGLGIFGLLKNKLPKGVAENLSGLDGKSFLGKLARNRALKLFGIGGVALFGVGKLYEYIEGNSSTLGEIPSDAEGKKTWWKNALEKAGIGTKEGAEEIWAVLNGSKLEEHFENKEPEKGYVYLQDHKTIQGAKREVLAFEKRCEIIFNEHRDAFNAAGAFGLILKPGMFVGATFKGTALMLSLLKFASPGLIIPAGLIVGLTNNSIEGIQHIQVPENLGPEDIADMLNIGDMSVFLKSHMEDFSDEINFDAVAREVNTIEQKIKEFSTEDFLKKILGKGAEKLIQTEQEKINSVNVGGFQTLIKELELKEIQSGKKGTYEKLLGTKESLGILKKIHLKVGSGESLKEADIRDLLEATEGTNIRIFPRDESKEGITIQYIFVDEHGNRQGLPKNICINPTISHASQYEGARDFVINEYELSSLNVLGKVGNGFRDILSKLTESIKTNNEKSGSILEALFRNGGSIATIGLETFAVDYLGNKYFLGPWNLIQGMFLKMDKPEDKLEMQEGLIEYGQSLAPVFVITAGKNLITGHGFWGFKNRGIINGLLKNSIVQSVTYPLEIIGKGVQGSKIAIKYIWNRALAGDYKSVFSDPKNQLKGHFYENIHRMKSLQGLIPTEKLREIGGKHSNIAKLEEARKILYRAKQSYIRKGDINEAIKILGHSSAHFEKLTPGELASNEQIQKLIEKVEIEITEQKKGLGILEGKVKKHMSEHPEILKEKTPEKKISLDPQNPEHKKKMENFMETSRTKLQEIEKERAGASKLFKDGKITKTEFDQKMGIWTQREGKIMRLQEHIHLKLHGKPLHGTKLGRFGRGLAGLVLTIGAVIATQVAIEKWKANDTDIPIPELDNESDEEVGENNDSFYGFGKKETDKKKVDSTSEKTEKVPEDIAPCLEKIETIINQYQLSFFSDPEAIAKADDTTIEQNIRTIEDSHEGLVSRMKSLLKEYKEPLKKYWPELKKKGEAINIKSENLGHLNAFMAIKEKSDGIYLESMNKTDVSETLWGIVDGVKNGGIGHRLMETGMGLLPVTSEIQDAQYAYREFSRGHIGDGFVHVGFFFLDTVLDVVGLAGDIVTSESVVGPVAIEAGKAGLKGTIKKGFRWVAKVSIKGSKFEKVKGFIRGLQETEKFKKNVTPWLAGWRNNVLRLPSGDIVNMALDVPRSNSVKIDSL